MERHGTTLDLFDDIHLAGATPAPYLAAFDTWLAQRQAAGELREASSSAVYRSMWSAFAEWCLGRGLVPERLDAADLEAYLASRATAAELSDRYAWRLLTLIEQVLGAGAPAHPGAAAARALRRVRPQLRYANAAQRTPLPEHLDAAQARRLVDWLLDPSGDAIAGVGPSGSWQGLRARASVALQLGAGLTPAELRALPLGGVVCAGGRSAGEPWKLGVPALGPNPAREAPLAPWAARLLRRWLEVRAELHFAGPWVFPAARDGRPWSRVAQYNAARAVLAAAGTGEPDGGSYRLRHTFALRQLRRGSPPEQVARWLGMADTSALWRYRRVLLAPADVI